MNERELFYVDREFHAPLPRTYWIEISARCNLKCPFCPTANGLYHSDVPMMRFGVYKRMFEKIRDHALFIYFHRHGEPTLNKDLFRIIRHTTRHGGIYTLFSTNLNTLRFDTRKADQLVDTGIAELILSIDGASPESYARYRRGGSFAVAMQNLEGLAAVDLRLAAAE